MDKRRAGVYEAMVAALERRISKSQETMKWAMRYHMWTGRDRAHNEIMRFTDELREIREQLKEEK